MTAKRPRFVGSWLSATEYAQVARAASDAELSLAGFLRLAAVREAERLKQRLARQRQAAETAALRVERDAARRRGREVRRNIAAAGAAFALVAGE